jgi:hypothetical protein
MPPGRRTKSGGVRRMRLDGDLGGEDNEGAEREMISAVRKRARVSGELPWMGGETGARYDRRRPME